MNEPAAITGPVRLVDLDSSLLRSFVAVVDAGGLTAASARLGLTQSGVSVRLRRLEDRLGLRVLSRSSRSLELTPEGELLLGYARRILALNDEAVRRLVEPDLAGLLRIGITEYLAPHRLPDLVGRFAQLYPRLRLEVRTGLGMDLQPLLRQGGLDVLIAGLEDGEDGFEMLREPLVWAAGHAFVPDGSQAIPLAALPQPCGHRSAGLEALSSAGMRGEVVFTSSSVAGLQAAVRAGLGVAVLPASAVSADMRRLGAAQGMPPLPEIAIAAFFHDDVRTTVGQAFLGYLRQELGGGLSDRAIQTPSGSRPRSAPPGGSGRRDGAAAPR